MRREIPIAERAVAGAVVVNDALVWQLREQLRPDMFTDQTARNVYEVVIGIADEGKRATLALIQTRFGDPEEWVRVQTWAYDAQQDGGTPIDFASEIVQSWRHRKAKEIGQAFVKSLDDPDTDVDTSINAMAEHVQDLVGRAGQERRDFGHIVGRIRQVQRDEYANRKRGGYDTGLQHLDEILGSIMDGRLTVFGGAPGAGKTILGEMLVERVARTAGGVLMFQRDMGPRDVVNRSLSRATGFSVRQIEAGDLNMSEFEIIEEAARQIEQLDFEMDTVSTTIEQIAAAAKAKKRTGSLKLIVVDHLRKFGTQKKVKDKWETFERVSGGLKELAVALNVPVVCLSQITRFSQRKDVPIPEMADLDGGGALEQDADSAVILFNKANWILKEKLNGQRPERRHDPDEDEGQSRGRWIEAYFEAEGKVEAHVVKNRLGRPGQKCWLKLNGQASRFEDV